VADLEKYLQEKLGLGEGALLAAIDRMSEVADQEMGLKVKDVWGIVEKSDDIETITFTGFAFTEKELEDKTKLFLAGVQKLKEFLEATVSSSGSTMVGTSAWNI